MMLLKEQYPYGINGKGESMVTSGEYVLIFVIVVIANMFANLWGVPMIKKWFHME